ncbi:hypothetical protein tb265_24370 [Gemmatimonadetes bacterium T265]|nr:hypothetical protein tb265_24370 [Gemmatimonadetes bacterium T265]
MSEYPNPLGSITEMVTGNPGINMGTTGSMRDTQYYSDDLWNRDSEVLRQLHPTRAYAGADRPYEHYEPAYRYGAASATQHAGREWHDVEGDMERGWDKARGASASAWHEVKDAARDAWHHVRGGTTGGTTQTTVVR